MNDKPLFTVALYGTTAAAERAELEWLRERSDLLQAKLSASARETADERALSRTLRAALDKAEDERDALRADAERLAKSAFGAGNSIGHHSTVEGYWSDDIDDRFAEFMEEQRATRRAAQAAGSAQQVKS